MCSLPETTWRPAAVAIIREICKDGAPVREQSECVGGGVRRGCTRLTAELSQACSALTCGRQVALHTGMLHLCSALRLIVAPIARPVPTAEFPAQRLLADALNQLECVALRLAASGKAAGATRCGVRGTLLQLHWHPFLSCPDGCCARVAPPQSPVSSTPPPTLPHDSTSSPHRCRSRTYMAVIQAVSAAGACQINRELKLKAAIEDGALRRQGRQGTGAWASLAWDASTGPRLQASWCATPSLVPPFFRYLQAGLHPNGGTAAQPQAGGRCRSADP